jgi:hypothetical protein
MDMELDLDDPVFHVDHLDGDVLEIHNNGIQEDDDNPVPPPPGLEHAAIGAAAVHVPQAFLDNELAVQNNIVAWDQLNA